ncbi:MAG: aminopeptidase [Gammaproteobacteria bacterium]|nr:MAG: aminopeptidase [Gammaproteobacteria bacterium]
MVWLFRCFFLAGIFFLVACSEMAYYQQAAVGQLSLLAKREPIEELLSRESTSAKLRAKLELILAARKFAVTELSLPTGNAYLDYVDIKQRYVIWNVTAAKRFSLEGETWCYPFVGCQTYRGYFAQSEAQQFAQKLSDRGLDVYVSGVTAYSTLGWFDDPVLNTFITRSDPNLAALVFHELAHRVVYIDGDTAFNESFATAVELAGLKRWLEKHDQADQLAKIRRRKHYHQRFTQLVLATNTELKKLYKTPLDSETMLNRKRAIIEQLRRKYAAMSKSWSFRGYDRWFASEINNAKLITVANYQDYVPAFARLLQQCNHDFPRFYKAVERLGALPVKQRRQQLKSLASESALAASPLEITPD